MKQNGIEERIGGHLPGLAPVWTRSATAALLQQWMSEQQGGYAITAKPSANLYILLQACCPPGLFCNSVGCQGLEALVLVKGFLQA